MKPRLQLLDFKSLNNLVDESRNLARKIPVDTEAVIGIPRSGMVPAYTVALSAGDLPVWSLEDFLAGRPNARGHTRGQERMATLPSEVSKVILVDDVVLSGASLSRAVGQLSKLGLEKITTCCPFVINGFEDRVDVGGAFIDAPGLYEWNFSNHALIESACVDFDGVLCFDPHRSHDDDGDKYLHFLRSARPRYRFSRPIGAIVTSRLSKYRVQTEAWLKSHGIEYKSLYMLDAPDARFRTRHEMAPAFKAKVYRETNSSCFIESEHWQAQLISQRSGLSVVCTDTMQLVTPRPSPRSQFWLRKMAKVAYRKLRR